MINYLLCFGVGLSTFLLNKIIIKSWLIFLKKNLDWKENLPAVWMGRCPAAVFNGVVLRTIRVHGSKSTVVPLLSTELQPYFPLDPPSTLQGKESKGKTLNVLLWLTQGPTSPFPCPMKGTQTGLPNNLYMPTILQNTGGSLRILEEQRQTH